MSQPQCHEKQRKIVLVVDDNPAIRDMVSWALELNGYDPVEASEGQEALDWVKSATSKSIYPTVIVLDLTMPGMCGRTFLQQLRAYWQRVCPQHPLPAIVVVTAETSGVNAASLGVEQVVAKPFHVRDLLDVVRKLAR